MYPLGKWGSAPSAYTLSILLLNEQGLELDVPLYK